MNSDPYRNQFQNDTQPTPPVGSFAGGVGDMFGTILGVFLIQAFNTGLIMVNVSTFWQYVARGALLLFALTSDYIRKQRREKELLEASMKNLG